MPRKTLSEKIGVGITTCNRPDFFKDCVNSIDLSLIDHLVVVNDGKPFDYKPNSDKIIFIQNENNLGVSKTKNKIFKKLLEFNCDHIFTLEDDCIITDNEVWEKYIETSKATGIPHFNFGPGSPWNRKQEDLSIIGDLSKRHLATQETDPNPRLVINYSKDISISLFQHIVAMFCYFNKSILEEVGLMEEEFYNAWEHVEHTYRIIKKRKYTPFWWFADVSGSEKYIKEAKGEKSKTSLAKNEETFMKQVQEGLQIFYKKHQTVPGMISDQVTLEDIKKLLKEIKTNE
jgi:GT2 family glycosyltransferase